MSIALPASTNQNIAQIVSAINLFKGSQVQQDIDTKKAKQSALENLHFLISDSQMPKQSLAFRPTEKTEKEGLSLYTMHTTKPENFGKPMGKEEKIHAGAWFHGSGAKKTGIDHMFHLDDSGKAKNKFFHFTKDSISGVDGAPNVNLHGSKNGDGKAMTHLFQGSNEAKYLNDEQMIGLRRRMTQSRSDKKLDASQTMEQIGKIGKKHGKDSVEMSNYLQKIGAEVQSPGRKAQIERENLNPDIKHNGIQGLDLNVDLSVFESYKIEGKDKNNKNVSFKVSAEQVATSSFLNGRLQGAVDKDSLAMDFSNWKDVKISGTLRAADDEDNGKTHRHVENLSIAQLNKVFSSEEPHKAFSEFRPKRRNFFQKVFGGIKDVFVGIGKGVASVAKGVFNGVKDVVIGGAKMFGGVVSGVFTGDLGKIKDGVQKGWDHVSNGVSHVASGFSDGLSNTINGFQSGMTSATGALFGDGVGQFFGDIYGKVGNFTKDVVTQASDGFDKYVTNVADTINSRDSFLSNIKDMASGAFETVTGVTGVGSATKGAKAIPAVIKGVATDSAKISAAKLAIKVGMTPAETEKPNSQENNGKFETVD